VAYKLIIIGGGRMGSALAEGLVNANWSASDLAVVETSAEHRAVFNQRLPGVAVLASLEIEHVDDASGVVICVKPEHAEAVARAAGAMGATRLLSVVAGLSTARIEATLKRRSRSPSR
jgi:pyrroline-5-carboxylate reductase